MWAMSPICLIMVLPQNSRLTYLGTNKFDWLTTSGNALRLGGSYHANTALMEHYGENPLGSKVISHCKLAFHLKCKTLCREEQISLQQQNSLKSL